MVGTMDVGSRRWTAPSSIFYWVVDTAADRVPDLETVDVLREVSDLNLGWLDLDGVPPTARRSLLEVLVGLPSVAQVELPASPARADVLRQVQELARIAAEDLASSDHRAAGLLLSDTSRLLLEAAIAARAVATEGGDAFDRGRLSALHEVVSLMQQQAQAFGVPLADLGLEGVDPDRDLL